MLKEGEIKFRGRLAVVMHPRKPAKLGVDGNIYGITKWYVTEEIEGKVSTDKSGMVTIVGDFYTPVQEREQYTLVCSETFHPTYGKQYKISYIVTQRDYTNKNDQIAFLRDILTENQINNLYRVYDNPIELLKKKDVAALTEVDGIGESRAIKMIERFHNNADTMDISVQLAKYNLTPIVKNKLLLHYKSPEKVIEVFTNNPYQMIKDINGFGFKTVDEIALRGGVDPSGVYRIKEYIKYELDRQAEELGNSYITAIELMGNLNTFFDGLVEVDSNIKKNIATAINELKTEGIIIVEENEDNNKARRRVYLKKTYELEEEIVYHLLRLMNTQRDFDYSHWEEKLSALEDQQGWKFDDDQKNGILKGLASPVCFITGLGGSGKSSLVAGILACFTHKQDIAQIALSGKAAAKLQEVTGKSGKTIHRLLEYSVGSFDRNENNPIREEIIILDELSLVGGDIFLSLLRAIKNGSKLICLGDMGQLEAIGKLNLAMDFYTSKTIPVIELTKVYRQKGESGIISLSRTVRNQIQVCDSDFEGNLSFGSDNDMHLSLSQHNDLLLQKTLAAFSKWYNTKEVGHNINNLQLIAPVRDRGDLSVNALNSEIQKLINPIREDEFEEEILKLPGKTNILSIHRGDKVMCIKNMYSTKSLLDNLINEGLKKKKIKVAKEETTPIFNGWIGRVVEVDKFFVKIEFELAGSSKEFLNSITQDMADEIIANNFEFSDKQNIETYKSTIVLTREQTKESIILGYASTVHKLQGSDAPYVIGCIDYSTPPGMLTRQLLYTLITRAKKRCLILGQTGAIRKCISSDYVSTKRTFMPEILEENNYQKLKQKYYKNPI